MAVQRFPGWVGKMVSRLCTTWNTRIVVTTKQERETSDLIKFNKGLPQVDTLCPRLFTICLNPVAWQLKASEGYKLSKPISAKITDLLYIDDLKMICCVGDEDDQSAESHKRINEVHGHAVERKEMRSDTHEEGRLGPD